MANSEALPGRQWPSCARLADRRRLRRAALTHETNVHNVKPCRQPAPLHPTVVPSTTTSGLKEWQIDAGEAPGTTTADQRRIAELERELRRVSRNTPSATGVAFWISPGLPWPSALANSLDAAASAQTSRLGWPSASGAQASDVQSGQDIGHREASGTADPAPRRGPAPIKFAGWLRHSLEPQRNPRARPGVRPIVQRCMSSWHFGSGRYRTAFKPRRGWSQRCGLS